MPSGYFHCLSQRLKKLPLETDAFRVIDGRTDGYPEIFVDQLADRILVSTRNRNIPTPLLQELRESKHAVFHKELDQDTKLPPRQIAGPEQSPVFTITEQGIRFRIDMSAGYSQGIFLDQRNNRQKIRLRCREGNKILNTFAYTGAFSAYAAMGGATTTTLDLAQPCLDWAKENFLLNGLSPDDHFFCKGDTLHWLSRFAKQKKQFDGIILDPPTFSRDKEGRIWRVESDYGRLVKLASECLAPGGWIFCSTNCRKLPLQAFISMVSDAVPQSTIESLPMPFDFRDESYLKALWLDFPQ